MSVLADTALSRTYRAKGVTQALLPRVPSTGGRRCPCREAHAAAVSSREPALPRCVSSIGVAVDRGAGGPRLVVCRQVCVDVVWELLHAAVCGRAAGVTFGVGFRIGISTAQRWCAPTRCGGMRHIVAPVMVVVVVLRRRRTCGCRKHQSMMLEPRCDQQQRMQDPVEKTSDGDAQQRETRNASVTIRTLSCVWSGLDLADSRWKRG